MLFGGGGVGRGMELVKTTLPENLAVDVLLTGTRASRVRGNNFTEKTTGTCRLIVCIYKQGFPEY